MAPSGAGAVVTIFFLLMCSSLACGLEIIEFPSDTTVFLDHTAVFTCETRGADYDATYAYWRVNGTAYNSLPPAIQDDLDTDQESVGENKVYTLTIPGRAEYNETVLQCVAGGVAGDSLLTIESANATLRVQAFSVGNLKAENSSTSITISWSAPFSVHPDIRYTVLISNVTDEDHPTDVPCADCHNLTQTHYTFIPHLLSPCHKYAFTVTPQNGAGQGERSQPVIGVFNSGDNFSIKEAYARWKPDTEKGDEVTITLEEVDGRQDVCSYRIFLFMDPIMEPISRVRSEGNVLVFKTRRLARDEEYVLIIEATISRNVTNSTLKLSTHDVQSADAEQVSGGVNIKGELAENTDAIGCFFVVRCQTDDPENYAISPKTTDGTCSTTVPDLKANDYTINVYDMESNAQPGSTPAVPLNVSVTNSGGSSGTPNIPSSSVVTDIVFQRSNGSLVNITCKFSSTLQDDDLACIIIWHKKGNNTLNSTMQHMGDAPSVIETEAEEDYSFVVFGKQGGTIDPYPVVTEEMHKAPGQDNTVVVGVIVSTIVIVAVFAGTVVVILVTKRKCSVRGNHNIKRQSSDGSQTSNDSQASNGSQTSRSSTSATSTTGLIQKEKESHGGCIKADGDNQSQAQVVLDMETMTKETEGEESKYSSVLTSTSGIRPPTVEKPVHYDQIDINATKRKAHPHGLLYDKVVPVPEGQGPKPNKMADDPKTHYADILPHTISFSPNTESKEKVPKKEVMTKGPPTVEAVMTLLWCVARRWKEIADGFGIDEDLVDEIFTNNETDEACLQDCVEKWMKLGPTWKKLANVLRGMGEERLAEQAASKAPPELQRQICNETLPSESTDEGFMQEGTSESGSSDDSAFVPSTNNSGQTPAVQQNSDNRGTMKTVNEQGENEPRQVGPETHLALQEHNHIYVNKNTACLSEDEEEEENANVVYSESETSSSTECSSDEEDNVHIVGVRDRLPWPTRSSCFKEPPIPSSRPSCEDVLTNAMETLSDYSGSKMEAGRTKISKSDSTFNFICQPDSTASIVCQPNAVFRKDQQDRGNDSDREIFSGGLMTESPQSCTDIPTEGTPLARAKYSGAVVFPTNMESQPLHKLVSVYRSYDKEHQWYSGTAVFSTNMESQPLHKNISLYRSYDEEKHNDELHAYSLRFMQVPCSTLTVESHAGMVIGRSLTMPCHMESSKTVEEPPNESHEEYLPPQQPPADKSCELNKPEAPVKNYQWSDPPDNYRERMQKWTYTGVALGFHGPDCRISINGRNSHRG